MLIDNSRTFWKPIMSKFSFCMDLYRQFRPLIFLPFNIWFFFVALPFRLFFAITSSLWGSQSPSLDQVKEKVTELKEEVIVPTLRPNTTVQRRPLHSDSDRLHGWFAVEKTDAKDESKTHRRKKSLVKSEEQSERIVEQPKESAEESKEIPRDDSAELRAQLTQIEDRERATLEEKQSLERQLEDLTAKYNDDEQALATFDHDKQRFRTLISVEQKKCFDFQQQIIALKNQLKSEHESKVHAEEQLNLLKKQNKTEKRKASKASKADKSLGSSDESVSTLGKESSTVTPDATESHPQSAWHSAEHKAFTEMVADAQRDELEHSKSFSEVLKTAVHMNEPVAPLTDSKPEFVVIGGDLSTQHITAL